MLCHVCQGNGCHMVMRSGKPEYWPCPCCYDAGATVQFGPPTVGRVKIPARMTETINQEAERPEGGL